VARKTALISGGAGYLGSHVAKLLKEQDFEVHIIDIFQPSHNYYDRVFHDDVAQDLNHIFQQTQYDIIYHFAARIEVSLSNKYPVQFWYNNVAGTINILNMMKKYSIKNIVFSSTAAVYQSDDEPLKEYSTKHNNSIYGKTKLICEQAIHDADVNYVIFRFFNLAGADESGLIGENHIPETHLIPNLISNEECEIYGNDYPTFDGTCVRDYVHVNDVADACLKAYDYLINENSSVILNLGSGQGSSIMQVIDEIERITNNKINYTIKNRREGDAPYLVADIERANLVLDWKPTHSLAEIIKSAINYKKTVDRKK
jgi:UDP-glucose 4-epimerase